MNLENSKPPSHIMEKKFKVLVPIGDLPLAHKRPDGKGYEGIMYNIWLKIKDRLKNKYEFQEYFEETANYDEKTRQVVKGEYDLVISNMQLTPQRENLVHFSQSVLLNKHTILHYPRLNILKTIKNIVVNIILGPILILISIGLLLGFILNLAESNRYKKTNISKKFGLRRSITTVIASLFGESGFLTENTTLQYKGLLIVLFILIISFFSVMIIQAFVTKKVIDLSESMSYNNYNIKNKKILCPRGNGTGIHIERYGAIVEYIDGTIPEVLKVYKENKDEYIGVALDYYDAIDHTHDSNGFIVSESDFGYVGAHFIANKKYETLINDINDILLDLQFNMDTYHICKEFMNPGDDVHLCNL